MTLKINFSLILFSVLVVSCSSSENNSSNKRNDERIDKIDSIEVSYIRVEENFLKKTNRNIIFFLKTTQINYLSKNVDTVFVNGSGFKNYYLIYNLESLNATLHYQEYDFCIGSYKIEDSIKTRQIQWYDENGDSLDSLFKYEYITFQRVGEWRYYDKFYYDSLTIVNYSK